MGKKGQTTKELPEALEKVNTNGKLNNLIHQCRIGVFHDFKTQLVTPKIILVENLNAFPECKEIAEDIKNGYYDDNFK